MKPTKPSRLDRAAEKYATDEQDKTVSHWDEVAFRHGADWMARAIVRGLEKNLGKGYSSAQAKVIIKELKS
jgi:hypothetical protein